MQRALMWLNLPGCEAVRHKLKNGLKTQKNAFFACFRAYVRQPHNHIGWTTSISFWIDNYPGFQPHATPAYLYATQCTYTYFCTWIKSYISVVGQSSVSRQQSPSSSLTVVEELLDSRRIFIGYSSDIHRTFIGHLLDIHRTAIGQPLDGHLSIVNFAVTFFKICFKS